LFNIPKFVNDTMLYEDAYNIYSKNKYELVLPLSDSIINRILSGGIHPNLIYIMYGDLKIITNIITKSIILSQKIWKEKNTQSIMKIGYISCYNRFNPYFLSKLAIQHGLSPTNSLKNIMISRVFTWEQMVEVLQNHLNDLKDIKMLIISGFTNLFPLEHKKEKFEQLLRSLDGLRDYMSKNRVYLILTGRTNRLSLFRPEGGKILSHFCHVLLQISSKERYIEYKLIEHPFLPERELKKYKPKKYKLRCDKIRKLDSWL